MIFTKDSIFRFNNYFGLIFLSLAFFFFYSQTLIGLFHLWLNDGDYSYVFAIPFITGYLVWQKRKYLAVAPISTCWIGGVFAFTFLVISLFGILGSSPSAVRPALPLMILSITLFCFGTNIFKLLLFPLSLLVFMIPLPTVFQAKVGVPLKLISTKLGELIMRILDVSVFVEGNIIDLGVTQLQVADACSGLRYILPTFALGVIFVYFFEKSRWKQIVLVISTIPIAIIANALRIGITGFLSQKFSLHAADSFFHGFSGWLLFVFSLWLIFALYYLLRILFRERPAAKTAVLSDNHQKAASASSNNKIHVLVSTAILVLAGSLNYATAALPPLKIDIGFSNFPLTINGWHGRPAIVAPEIIRLSGAEDAFNGIYTSDNNNVVSLYIGYRGSPFTESENFFHSPNVCLPSLGWKTLDIADHMITGVPKFNQIVVRKMLIEKMGQRQLVYYWFQTKSRVSPNVNINRLHLALHALSRDNTYDLFIRPIAPLGTHEAAATAEKKLDQFVREMMGVLLKFVSDNQRIR